MLGDVAKDGRDPSRFDLEVLESRVLLSGDGVSPEVPASTEATPSHELAESSSLGGGATQEPGAYSVADPALASGGSVSDPLSDSGPLPALDATEGGGNAVVGSKAGLHAVTGISDLVNPAEATPLLLAPGKVTLEIASGSAGRAGLWKFVLPSVPGGGGRAVVRFDMNGSAVLPTDTAIAWYDESGNLLGVADASGSTMIQGENSGDVTVELGRAYLVGVFANRAVPGGTVELDVAVPEVTLASRAGVVLNTRSGEGTGSYVGQDDVFQSPTDVRWHPLTLLNAGDQASVKVTPEVAGRDLSIAVYRRVASLQLAGTEDGVPAYELVGRSSSSGTDAAEVLLKAPSGSSLSEQSYVVAVAPKDYVTAAGGYRIDLKTLTPLLVPATLTQAEVNTASAFALKATATAGLSEAEIRNQVATGESPRFFTFRSAASGRAVIRVDAAFNAVVALYNVNRGLVEVATQSRQGKVTLTATVTANELYTVRVVNEGGLSPLEGTGFQVELTAPTAPRFLGLSAPANGAVGIETGGFTISASSATAPNFFTVQPAVGLDVLVIRVQAPSNGSLRVSAASVDGFREQSYAVGEFAVFLLPIQTQGAPVQVAVASTGSFGALFYYGGLALPRELAVGALAGRQLSVGEGKATSTVAGFDRTGERAGFEFYQGVVPAGRSALWTAEGAGGATPILVRYETRGSVLRLVDWELPDATKKAEMSFTVGSETLYAIVAYQPVFWNGGSVKLSVDHPEPIPVGVGMVPDLVYEQANQNPARFRYILQIRGMTLERSYEEDYWETLLPDRFYAGGFSDDPAMPLLEVIPDTPGSALRLVVSVLDGEGDPLRRWNGDPVPSFRSGSDGAIRVDFATLGVFRQALEGKNLQFRVRVDDGALGDGTYTLRMTVRTPNPNPYFIDEKRWDYPGSGVIPAAVGAVDTFPSGTSVVDIPQNPSGEGSIGGLFASSSVGVRLYRFWTPSSGPIRVWTEGIGNNPANTTIKLYRARYAVTGEGERDSWWENIDYLEELREVPASLDWYPADRSVIDAQVIIEDPEFPAYKQPTNPLGQSTVGNPPESQLRVDPGYLPADRQFSDKQDVYFVVVKNEQGSTGTYQLHVSTDDLPKFQRNPLYLPHMPTSANSRSVISVEVPDVERYGNRIGVYEIQMPERHSGYLGVSGQVSADWKFELYGPNGDRLSVATTVDGEDRYLVPVGGVVVTLKVLETGKNTEANDRITLATTLIDPAGLPTNFSALGLGNIAQTLLPTNPWGELDAGEFTGSAPVDSAGRLFRFRVPTGKVDIEVAPIAGSPVSFLWGLYDDGRLLAWDLAIPGQPATHRTTIAAAEADAFDSLAGAGRNLVLVVRHASGSVQPAQFTVEIHPESEGGFGSINSFRTSVPLPALAFEAKPELRVLGDTVLINEAQSFTDWQPDQWMRFVVPDGPGQVVKLVDLPENQNVYPLRYDVYDAAGKERVATGTKTFSTASEGIDLPQLEGGKAYVLRLAPRDQPLGENLPVHVRFRPAKAVVVNGEFAYNVPSLSVPEPPNATLVNKSYAGDFSLSESLAGKTTVWWYTYVPKSGPATLKAVVQGSNEVGISIYRNDGSGEFPDASLVDFVNESSDVATADGKEFTLKTFLGQGGYFIQLSRANSSGGQVELNFEGPEYDIERLTPDAKEGVVLRAQMGRATGTQFFDVIAPVGSYGPASFLAYDLDLFDDRPQTSGNPPTETTVELTVRARMVVWAVSSTFGTSGGLTQVLSRTLGRAPQVDINDPVKATLETLGIAQPFQRYIIGIQFEGIAPGYVDEISGRSKSIGVQAAFVVPTSGTPDLTIESMRLLPNNGQTTVEVTVLNRGYAVAFGSQSEFSYPTLNADDPLKAIVFESILGPQTRRVRYLDWIDPVSPEDVTRYQLDVGGTTSVGEIIEVDETNNLGQVAMKSVNAYRPAFSVSLGNGLDGNSDPGVWGRYLDSRNSSTAEVHSDITMSATDGDDAANTYDDQQEIYRLRSDAPWAFTSGDHYLQNQKIMEEVEISALAPTGPGTPNIFSAYAVDRFGLRSDTVVRVIQVVPFPKWMEAGETEVVFNPNSKKYELEFSARPVDYEATLTQMLDANIPLVGDLQNQFYVEAIAEREFSLDPTVSISPIHPSIRARAKILGRDILNKVFGPGTGSDYVSVQGQIDVRPDTLEASAFQLTTRFDQYPVDRWEGPEIPIFGFDAAVVSAAVQAQVIVDLKFDAAITFAFDLTQTNAPLRITSPSFVGLDLRVELRFEGEVEVAGFLDIASVGGGFFFTLKPRYGLEEMPGSIPLEDFLDEACLGLSATIGGELSADIFGFEVFSIELESDEIQLTDCDVATSSMAGATALTGTTGTWAREGRLGLQNTKPALPNDKYIRYTQTILSGDAVLPTPSVRPNPQLIVDAATGERMMAYLDSPTPGASPVMYVARGNADGFGAPVALTSTEWMSRPLLMATRDGAGLRAVLVYQTTPIPTAATTRNQFLSGHDLKYRYFDGTTWGEEVTLTDNAFLDWQAAMSFNANGDGALVWLQKTTATALDAKGWLAGREQAWVSRWDMATHRWLTPAAVGGLGTLNHPAVTVALNGIITVGSIERSGNVYRVSLAQRSAAGTWTVASLASGALSSGGRPRKLALAAEPDGRVTVVVAYTDALVKGQPAVTRVLSRTETFNDLRQQNRSFQVLATTGGVSSLQIVTAPDGNLVVGWQERRGSFSDAVVVRRQTDGTWTRPARVTQSAGDERAMRFAVDANGAVLTVYERGVHYFSGAGGKLVPADGLDLKTPSLASGLLGSGFAARGPELNIAGPLTLDGLPGDQRPEALAGTTVQAQIDVRNSGGTTADALVTFYRVTTVGLGTRNERVGEKKIRVVAGGSVLVGVPVEIALGQNRFVAEVELAGGRDVFNTRDNSVSGQVTGRIDLAVEALSIADQVAGNPPQTGVLVGLRYEIVNRSGVAYRGPLRVTSYWEDPTKPGVRTTVNSGTGDIQLAPGQRQALAGLFTFETAGLRLVGVEIGDTNLVELSTGNNRALIPLDLRPDLALVDVEVPIRGGGTELVPSISVRVNHFSGISNAELGLVVSNVGSAPVRSFTLRIFHSVDGGAFTEVLSQSVTASLKPGELRATTFKVSALAGTNVYRAEVMLAPEDLPTGHKEPVTADNVAMTSVVVQGLPDLQVGSVTFSTPGGNPPTLRVGGLARVDVVVENKGIAVAKGVLVEVFAMSRGQAGDGILLGSAVVASVGALDSETVRIGLNTNLLPETADSIRVVLDRHQNILERSDMNNTAGRPIVVAPPAFTATQGFVNVGVGQLSRVSSLSVAFSRDLVVPRDPGVLRIQNTTTGEFVDPTKYTVSLNAATRTVTWQFTGLEGGVLPAGEYVARIAAAAISDRSSNALGREFVMRFTVTRGDANGDGVTNEKDYLLIWRELRKAEGARNVSIDLDGDGKVTTADLDLVKGNLGKRGASGGVQP